MKHLAWMAPAWFASLALVATLCAAAPPAAKETGAMAKFTLTSTDLTNGGTIANAQVFNEFGCKGSNVSPALAWSGAPSDTKSFALLVHDPDAPTGSGWWHWVVYNIPAGTSSLPSGAGDPTKELLPQGTTQGATDFGQPGYGGPCPPQGDKAHRYIFTIHALDVEHL